MLFFVFHVHDTYGYGYGCTKMTMYIRYYSVSNVVIVTKTIILYARSDMIRIEKYICLRETNFLFFSHHKTPLVVPIRRFLPPLAYANVR